MKAKLPSGSLMLADCNKEKRTYDIPGLLRSGFRGLHPWHDLRHGRRHYYQAGIGCHRRDVGCSGQFPLRLHGDRHVLLERGKNGAQKGIRTGSAQYAVFGAGRSIGRPGRKAAVSFGCRAVCRPKYGGRCAGVSAVFRDLCNAALYHKKGQVSAKACAFTHGSLCDRIVSRPSGGFSGDWRRAVQCGSAVLFLLHAHETSNSEQPADRAVQPAGKHASNGAHKRSRADRPCPFGGHDRDGRGGQ